MYARMIARFREWSGLQRPINRSLGVGYLPLSQCTGLADRPMVAYMAIVRPSWPNYTEADTTVTGALYWTF